MNKRLKYLDVELMLKILFLWLMLIWNIIRNIFRCGISAEDIIAMVDVEMEYY